MGRTCCIVGCYNYHKKTSCLDDRMVSYVGFPKETKWRAEMNIENVISRSKNPNHNTQTSQTGSFFYSYYANNSSTKCLVYIPAKCGHFYDKTGHRVELM